MKVVELLLGFAHEGNAFVFLAVSVSRGLEELSNSIGIGIEIGSPEGH